MSFSSRLTTLAPAAWWRLGDTSGTTAVDHQATPANGTYTAGYTLNATSLVSGDSDKAVTFNGSTGYVDCGNPAKLQITGQVCMMCIVKVTTLPTSGQVQNFVGKHYDNTAQGFYLRLKNTSGQLQLETGSYVTAGDTNYHATGNVSWSANETHIIVGQYTGSNWEIWVDGGRIVTTAQGQGAQSTTKPFLIGAADVAGLTHFVTGVIDEVAVWNAAQAGSDILALAQDAGLASSPATFTSAVASAGIKVDLTFSASVTGVAAAEYTVVAGTTPLAIDSVSGATTAWSLNLRPNDYILSGQTVTVSYTGTSTVTTVGSFGTATVTQTATNSSTAVSRQSAFEKLGFGVFITYSSASYGASGYVSQATINALNPATPDFDQWCTQAVNVGARYVTFTTKHDSGFCWWPTTSGSYNISTTAYNTAHPGADFVNDFAVSCRAHNLKVGLYINFLDNKWLHDNSTYATGNYLARVTQQITELLTNYGAVSLLWVDTWAYPSGGDTVGYSTVPYATIQALVQSKQPNCLLLNNEHSGTLAKSEIAIYEDGQQSEPTTSNTLPAEYCEPLSSSNNWAWLTSADDAAKDKLTLLARYKRLQAARSNYLLNFTPNTSGVIPTAQVTFATDFGAMIGKQGGATYALESNVRSGVDRGDGATGTLAGGAVSFGF